jgi:nucleoside-diphosphate-sugar epimerase
MKVVIFGASGVVGHAAAEHFAGLTQCEVITVSRRSPKVPGTTHASVDLADRSGSARALADPLFDGTTHVIYAALEESANLFAGWRDPELMARNLRLFCNALDPLVSANGGTLEHVNLLQGAKAYGLHVGRTPMPAKENAPRADHDNFYFLQEDVLRTLAGDARWSWTILRPQVVFGESLGSPMNLLPAIGVYAALERQRGRPLAFPGGIRSVQEATDARLLARALAWAAVAPAARDQTFNVTNGDVYDWHEVWPTIAECLGMEAGEPAPLRLADAMPARAGEWTEVVDHYRLQAPRDMDAFVGASWQYADLLFGSLGSRPLPALLSSVKIRQAGFGDAIDTEAMFRQWFARFQEHGLLPRP